MFPQIPYDVLRRPLVRIILIFLLPVILFVAPLPSFNASRLFENVPLVPPQHQRPPLDLYPLLSPLPEQPSRHRIKGQRPLPEPAHDELWAQRADAVRGAFLHAYGGYLTDAAPHDELRPLARIPVDKSVCSLPRTTPASFG